jgi:hypothetical protein
MQVVAPAVADLLLHRAAHEIQPALVEPVALAIAPLIQIMTGAALAVARKRCSLSRRAASACVRPGDVAYEGAEHQLFAEADGRDRELHRETRGWSGAAPSSRRAC